MDAPKLHAVHTSSGCFDINSQPSGPWESSSPRGSMKPYLVEGSEPVQVHYEGVLRYGKQVAKGVFEERRASLTAQNHNDLLDKFQALVNAYYAD